MDCSQYVGAPSCSPPHDGGMLPFTGFDTVGVLVLALVIIACGVALRMASR